MDHTIFIEQVLTGLTPAQADGLACIRCGADYLTSKVSHRAAGRSETGSQVFACAVTCYAAEKLLAEAPERIERWKAAREIVPTLTDETIRLATDEVVAAGIKARRNQIVSDAHWALRRVREAAAKEIAVPPCPAWCTKEAGHLYGPVDEEFARYHGADLLRFEETNTGVEIMQYESVEDGVTVLEPVEVYVEGEFSDVVSIRSLARALTNAATMVEKLNAGAVPVVLAC